MRFGLLGSIVQIGPGSEGYLLWQADLIDKGGEDWEVEIQPTDLLRSLFTSMPEMGPKGHAQQSASARRLGSVGRWMPWQDHGL
jgi:hypothetical protein